MELTVINPPATLWDSKSDTAYDARLALGYSVYGLSTDPTVQADWIYVIYANGAKQIIDIPVGYEWVKDVEPNSGFSNTGATIDWVNGDVALQALATAYSIPSPITYAQMVAIDFDLIPEEDLRVTLKNGIFTNWAAQPYQYYQVTEGAYKTIENNYTVIKNF